ncbi:hypothetical protein BD769DRAFT_1388549 [Suillus cothurnatus]|nr:hypothetical protein BD769DRAFT_1388549 [Suillus cothurnatus]
MCLKIRSAQVAGGKDEKIDGGCRWDALYDLESTIQPLKALGIPSTFIFTAFVGTSILTQTSIESDGNYTMSRKWQYWIWSDYHIWFWRGLKTYHEGLARVNGNTWKQP